jgi:thioesterase domain-containing protein
MARDYIAEIRMVQPQGPYLLGGFSGGGIVAYEMARQLLEAGESVALVVMLDTPLPLIPKFSLVDRVSLFYQGLRRAGFKFVHQKIRGRIEWERRQYLRRRENQKIEDRDKTQFQSRRIGDAFMRAVASYSIKPVPVRVALFRPRLDIQFKLSGGRLVDSERNLLYFDNGWTPLVSSVVVQEVPGNHDSMVLEPNVRILVNQIRKEIAHVASRLDT